MDHGRCGLDLEVVADNGSVLVLIFTGVGRCRSSNLDPCKTLTGSIIGQWFGVRLQYVGLHDDITY